MPRRADARVSPLPAGGASAHLATARAKAVAALKHAEATASAAQRARRRAETRVAVYEAALAEHLGQEPLPLRFE